MLLDETFWADVEPFPYAVLAGPSLHTGRLGIDLGLDPMSLGELGRFASGDPWLSRRLKAFTDLVRAENGLFRAILRVLNDWAARLRAAVFGTGRTPDPVGVLTTQVWFEREVTDLVEVEIKEIFDFAAFDTTDFEPDAMIRVQQYLEQARNRLVRVPDSVYGAVRGATMKATSEGWSIDELAGRIDDILAESGAERWRNRAKVIARTEAVGAYNAGTFAGFVSYASQMGGAWEKIWLATHDHRTRFTHAKETGADGQRVGLLEPFSVGEGELMFPGDPMGPPEEIIQCRCSILLAQEGEIIDLSNRHFRRGT